MESPGYVVHLAKLLDKTPGHVLANYIGWRAASQSLPYLHQEARDKQQSNPQKRWMKCVNEANKYLATAVGSLYVQNYFKDHARKTAIEMVSEIKKQFLGTLDDADWMDDATKESARMKAKEMFSYVGYPVELLDMKKLGEQYKGLELAEDDYMGNILQLRIFRHHASFSNLKKPANQTDWVTPLGTAVVNAFYMGLENSIQIPAGILQGVFYSADRPMYMNYGAIGWVIGHEITHGFDNKGRLRDKDGTKVDWWLPETKSK